MTQVLIESSVKHDLKKLPRNIIEWVSKVINDLEENPFQGERLHLPSGLRGLYCFKLRKGDYRLVYCYVPSRDTVYIVAIGHRDDIYKTFQRRMK